MRDYEIFLSLGIDAEFRNILNCHQNIFASCQYHHCRVPDKEWSFQDGGLYIIKKVGVKILTIIVLYRLS